MPNERHKVQICDLSAQRRFGEIKVPFRRKPLGILPNGNRFTYDGNTPAEPVHSLATAEVASAPRVLDLEFLLAIGVNSLFPA